MKIVTLPLSGDHWSSAWIPISYPKHAWTMWSMRNHHHRLTRGKTFLWSSTPKGSRYEQVMAICRVFPVTKDRVELGDLWLNPELRGKRNSGGVKHSLAFLRQVIARIWKLYSWVDRISLEVHRDNRAAIHLYEKLAFHYTRSLKSTLHLPDSIMMERQRGRFIRVMTTTPDSSR